MPGNIRILRRPQTQTKIGLGRSAIYDKLNPASASYDPEFPKPIHLGDSPTSPVGWIESELDAWLASRIALRAGGAKS